MQFGQRSKRRARGLNIARSIKDEEDRGRLRILAEEAMEGADAGFGVILRSASAGVDDDVLLAELAELVPQVLHIHFAML